MLFQELGEHGRCGLIERSTTGDAKDRNFGLPFWRQRVLDGCVDCRCRRVCDDELFMRWTGDRVVVPTGSENGESPVLGTLYRNYHSSAPVRRAIGRPRGQSITGKH